MLEQTKEIDAGWSRLQRLIDLLLFQEGFVSSQLECIAGPEHLIPPEIYCEANFMAHLLSDNTAGIISHLFLKDIMCFRVVLPMLTSWGDVASKYWFKMSRNASNRWSGSFVSA